MFCAGSHGYTAFVEVSFVLPSALGYCYGMFLTLFLQVWASTLAVLSALSSPIVYCPEESYMRNRDSIPAVDSNSTAASIPSSSIVSAQASVADVPVLVDPPPASSTSSVTVSSAAFSVQPASISVQPTTTSSEPSVSSVQPTTTSAQPTTSSAQLTTTSVPTTTVTASTTTTQPGSTTTTTAAPSTVTATLTAVLAPQWTTTAWQNSPQMTDLISFNVTYFPSGQHNLQVVQAIPANASASAADPQVPSILDLDNNSTILSTRDDSNSVVELFYPAGSIDPARKPEGGAQFYATPLDLSDANNVSLQYSVFFPVEFDFVKGGKLPGLYGGRTGCSGGDAALDCFSTRLMWRENGIGELYLYAPKDKQTAALCSDPQSVCDADYGLSIGRGSFNFITGNWTTVNQNVVLNTPGVQNGVFTLDVNGKRVINRSDVFYRDVVATSKPSSTPTPAAAPPPTSPPKHTPAPETPPPSSGGLLGPLLGLNAANQPSAAGSPIVNGSTYPATFNSSSLPDNPAVDIPDSTVFETITLTVTGSPVTQTVVPPAVTVQVYPTVIPDSVSGTDSSHSKPVGFVGLFFSTFFGGHEDDYATPKDQYAWFTGFAISHST